MKYLIYFYAVAISLLLANALIVNRKTQIRMNQNFEALGSEINHYKTMDGKNAASIQALRLRCGEYQALYAEEQQRVRELNLKISRLNSVATTAMAMHLNVVARLRDSVARGLSNESQLSDDVVVSHVSNQSLATRHITQFEWRDGWCSVRGEIDGDSVRCRVESRDTLLQVVHRVPRKFLFIKWGTKALRQEIVSSNPHTEVVYSRFIEIER